MKTFLGRNKPNNNFSMLQTNKLKRSRGTIVEVYSELRAINLYMEEV